jgi:hypothetical protein
VRYMLLVYTNESELERASPEFLGRVADGHRTVMAEARQSGAFVAAEPLAATASATTVRVNAGRPMILDGPFAETKEQLAGYYILNCRDLDEAISWASRIPTACGGGIGCIEIRPMRYQETDAARSAASDGQIPRT